MDLTEIEGSKLFQDSVHGVMRFHQLLVKFIDTPEFQRLRNIKQLSTTYLVYPAAAHNRFEHCLGVAWLAGEMMLELESNSGTLFRELLEVETEEERKSIRLAIQIAGLLHDIGHGPFSHTWENFVAACGVAWDHESTSCQLIDYMLKDTEGKLSSLGEEFKIVFPDMEKYIEFIKNVILGRVPEGEKRRAFLYQIVANKFNDVDVDKWDYFLRDAQHLNMGVSFDYKRLMKLSCVIMDENGESHIAFRDNERFSIQGMFRNRADLHVKAYQHRVAKCLEAMLIDALKEADENGFKVRGYALSKVQENPAVFITISDSIQELVQNTQEREYIEARRILQRLVRRDLYPNIGEWVLDIKQTEEEREKNKAPQGLTRKKLNELEDLLEHKYAISQVAVNQGKYYNPLKNIKFYNKKGRARERNNPDISLELPFYILCVFRRTKEGNDEAASKKVEGFLLNEGIFKQS